MGICCCLTGNADSTQSSIPYPSLSPSSPSCLLTRSPFPGPSKWSKTYPIAVTGTRQSPVDIRTDACGCRDTSKPLVIQYPDNITAATLANSGYGWVVNIPRDDALKTSLTGGPLEEKYVLEQFHAHWGPDCDCGSEHTINGKSYAAEVSLFPETMGHT